MTIQQAIRQLRAEGIVVTWPGRGTFVSDGTTAPHQDAGRLMDRLDAIADALHDLEERVSRLENTRPRAPRQQRDA
jgi:DNA-binding GntR family transcriptional regulator